MLVSLLLGLAASHSCKSMKSSKPIDVVATNPEYTCQTATDINAHTGNEDHKPADASSRSAIPSAAIDDKNSLEGIGAYFARAYNFRFWSASVVAYGNDFAWDVDHADDNTDS